MTPVGKTIRRRLRKMKFALARRFLNTRNGRELLINAISPKVMLMTADCGDHVMTFSPHDYIGRKIYRKGHFERDHVQRLLDVLKDRNIPVAGTVLLELGGNIGTQTIYFALTKTFRHIVSIEPDPRNFPLLSTNIARNGLASVITAINCAAGDTTGDIRFFMNRDNHGKSSASRQSPNDTEITVPVKPVDTLLQDAGIAPADIGLVWMDIEGYEPVACRSMQALMARRVPVYLEFSPTFYGKEGAEAFVRTLSGFYEDAVIFREDRLQPVKVADLPVDTDQFDVLLLP